MYGPMEGSDMKSLQKEVSGSIDIE